MANEIYNTSWWGTALDTARTAGTNPDFFGSQMKLLTSEQDNLVTNGTFDNTIPIGTNGSGWVKIVDGTNTVEYSNGGVKLARKTTSECKIYATTLGGSTSVLTSGKTYKLTYEVMSVNGSVILRYFNGSSYVTVSSQVGVHTLIFEQGSATGLSVFYNTTDNTDITIDNVSVQLVRADLDQIEAKKCVADWIHRTALQDLNN